MHIWWIEVIKVMDIWWEILYRKRKPKRNRRAQVPCKTRTVVWARQATGPQQTAGIYPQKYTNQPEFNHILKIIQLQCLLGTSIRHGFPQHMAMVFLFRQGFRAGGFRQGAPPRTAICGFPVRSPTGKCWQVMTRGSRWPQFPTNLIAHWTPIRM